MATPSTTARTPISRRMASTSSPSPPPGASSTMMSGVRGGTTARSAVPPKVATGALSSSTKRPPPPRSSPAPVTNGVDKFTSEALELALKRETEEKESLLLRLQVLEQTFASTTQENDTLNLAMASAETRLGEFYAEQARMEEEMAGRLEVIDKQREAMKDLEREKRDTLRRYNEQTATFEAERQAFYDSEQHLKSRIQTLSRNRRPSSPRRSTASFDTPLDDDQDEPPSAAQRSSSRRSEDHSESTEPAEMTALRLELSTLSTSHASIQNTLHLLQTQLNDLKRVNNELQEENESYNILLRERTMSGQFDIMRTAGNASGEDDDDEEDFDGIVSSPVEEERSGRPTTTRSRSTLDVVPEEFASPIAALRREGSPSSKNSKRSRRGAVRTGSPVSRGESLADLPVAGPGLDLAAELGRAVNKDILEGRVDAPQYVAPHPPAKVDVAEVQTLRSEVKALKDANKALSLYASKIIDRIIAQEGFEHVLAVDYDSQPHPKRKKSMARLPKQTEPKLGPIASFFPSRSNTIKASSSDNKPTERPSAERQTSDPSSSSMTQSASAPTPATPAADSGPPEAAAEKRARRGLSMDWKGITGLFGGSSANTPPPAEVKNDKLRPLTLKPGTTLTGLGSSSNSLSSARRIETVEDENDRRERERMLATMKLMGIEAPLPTAPLPSYQSPVLSGTSSPPQASNLQRQNGLPGTPAQVASPPPSSRVPFFTRLRGTEPSLPGPTPALTTQALEQAEAESALAAIEARDKAMVVEYAKGKTASTFTELNGGRGSLGDSYRKRTLQRSVSGSGSGSGGYRARASIDVGDETGSNHSRAGSVHTVFSAGTAE